MKIAIAYVSRSFKFIILFLITSVYLLTSEALHGFAYLRCSEGEKGVRF